MNIYRLTSLLLLLCSTILLQGQAQSVPDPQAAFEIVHQVDATSVKSQGKTGTCWSFSCSSFLESELMRMGKGEFDLSEMYSVRQTYMDKATRYVRLHGKGNFDDGSLGHDVLNVVARHGVVPQSAFQGKLPGDAIYDHDKMLKDMKKVLKKVLKNTPLSSGWEQQIASILDTYMGKVPDSFEYEGKTYTPRTFADERLGIRAGDYISFTSFTHHPAYSRFVLEVPDNYSHGSFYNLPLDELTKVVDNALEKGYSVEWDCDVSNPGFSPRTGRAVLPGGGPVDPAVRQKAFDIQDVTDDHLMHITGVAKDKNGNEFYLTKNSWGKVGTFKGYIYASKPYFQMYTISILVHKDAVPVQIMGRLGL